MHRAPRLLDDTLRRLGLRRNRRNHAGRQGRQMCLEPLESRDLMVASVGVMPYIINMAEGNPGTSGAWRIQRMFPEPTPLTVNFTLGGTAVEGADYQTISPHSATIPANQTSVLVWAVPINDPFYEPTESVSRFITPDPSYTITTGQAALSLQSEDPTSAPLEPVPSNDTVTCDCPCACEEATDTQQSSDGGSSAQLRGPGLKNNSSAAKSQTVIETNATFTSAGSSATSIEARSTFNGAAGPTAYYSGSGIVAGEKYRVALPIDTSSLESGYYPWEITVVEHYPHSPDITRTIAGKSKVRNTSGSEFGAGWLPVAVDKLKIQPSGNEKGVLWLKGDNNAFWFAENSPGVFTRPAAEPDFSTLTKEGDGTYTLRKKDGETLRFSPQGTSWAVLTSRTDRVGNATSYAYVDADSDGKVDEISTITYPGTLVTTFNFTGALVTSVTDPYGRVTTLGYTGNLLTT